MTYQQELSDDAEYAKAAREFLESSFSNPAFARKERGLMRAFAGMPRVESPKTTFGDERIFELRIYESHSRIKAQKKIDMFNNAGEIQIFRDTGLTPVFFGETLFGRLMPNLTYMLVFNDMADRDKRWEAFRSSERFNDMADRDKRWEAFRSSERWAAIKDLEEYKDTVSNITDIILRPAKCSQI
jgi:hypothetical protein